MNRILSTAFATSVLSYIVFLTAEYVRPGFVTHVFSVHWFLFAAVVFGGTWSLLYAGQDRRIVSRPFTILLQTVLSVVLVVIVWREGAVFSDMHGFIALAAGALPWIIPALLRHASKAPSHDNV